MKPTYGAISRYGMIAFASSLDQCGPLTRDVTDAAMLLRAMQGRDPCDSTSVGIEGGVELPSREDLRGLRFGIPRELAGDAEGIEAGVSENFEATLRLIEELGGELDQCELPSTRNGISAYYVIAPAEASANLARYDGVRYGMRDPEPEDLLGMYERTRARGFGAEVKRRIMLGTYALSSGYYEAYYGQAQKVRTRIAQDFDAAFARFDFLVTPTSPTVAFELGAKTADPWAMYMNDYCTVPMPLGGHPGDLDPFRTGRAGGRRSGAPGRIPDHRSRILRVGDPRRRLRVGASDRLHRTAGRVMSVEETEAAMREALDSLPGWVLDELGEVAVIVEDSHPEGLMGIYDPVGGLQRVVVFRNANPNADEVKRTVLHEIGHHFGMNEQQIDSLGFG